MRVFLRFDPCDSFGTEDVKNRSARLPLQKHKIKHGQDLTSSAVGPPTLSWYHLSSHPLLHEVLILELPAFCEFSFLLSVGLFVITVLLWS